MGTKVSTDQLADAIYEELMKYSDMAADVMKEAVTKAGNTAKKEIQAGAPVRTGKYKKSWRVKTTRDNVTEFAVIVHSPSRYQLTHLLEHGHAKRNGGRTRAFPHIGPAEEKAQEQLLKDIERGLSNG